MATLIKIGERIINADYVTKVERHNIGDIHAPKTSVKITFKDGKSEEIGGTDGEALWRTLNSLCVSTPKAK